MTGLMLTAEQIRSAPPEIRRWLKSILDTEFLLGAGVEHATQAIDTVLAACGPDEARAVFAQIRGDYLAAQVMLELGRHAPVTADGSRRIVGGALADLARHARLDNLQQLGVCLERISSVFGEIRKDPGAVLFAFDQGGGFYVHETTYQSFRKLWKSLVLGEIAATPDERQPPVVAPEGPA